MTHHYVLETHFWIIVIWPTWCKISNTGSCSCVRFVKFCFKFLFLFWLNRKDLVTRAANSTGSSRTLWSRAETSPEEMALEVGWPLTHTELYLQLFFLQKCTFIFITSVPSWTHWLHFFYQKQFFQSCSENVQFQYCTSPLSMDLHYFYSG